MSLTLNKSAMRDYAPRMCKVDVQKILDENAIRWRVYKNPRNTDEYLTRLAKNLGLLKEV